MTTSENSRRNKLEPRLTEALQHRKPTPQEQEEINKAAMGTSKAGGFDHAAQNTQPTWLKFWRRNG